MEPKHIVTQLVGAVVAAIVVVWAVRQARLDWAQRRIPLVRGSFSLRLLAVVLTALGTLAIAIYGVIALQLLPKRQVLALFGFFAWLTAIMIGGIMGAISVQLRRGAEGWLAILGVNVLAIEIAGQRTVLTLRDDSVALTFVARGPADVQFEFRDEDKTARLWGAVPLKVLTQVTEGPPQQPRGLMIGSSMKPLCEWLTPFIVRQRP